MALSSDLSYKLGIIHQFVTLLILSLTLKDVKERQEIEF